MLHTAHVALSSVVVLAVVVVVVVVVLVKIGVVGPEVFLNDVQHKEFFKMCFRHVFLKKLETRRVHQRVEVVRRYDGRQ